MADVGSSPPGLPPAAALLEGDLLQRQVNWVNLCEFCSCFQYDPISSLEIDIDTLCQEIYNSDKEGFDEVLWLRIQDFDTEMDARIPELY